MSVTAVNESFVTGGGSEGAKKRTYIRKFLIETDSVTDNVATILANRTVGGVTLPHSNDEFPGDPAAKCGIVSFNRLDALIWEATCPYEFNGDTSGTGSDAGKKPWELPPSNISISSYSIIKAVEKGYKAADAQFSPTDQITLPTGDKFDPPPTEETFVSILKFSYNVSTFYLDWTKSYQNTMNLNAMSILGVLIMPKTALLRSIGGQRNMVQVNEGDNYAWWQLNAEIALNDNGFDMELLLAGFHCLDGGLTYEIGINAGGVIVKRPAGDTTIDAVTEPQLLKADGTLVTDKVAIYKNWQTKYAKDWMSLSFPTSIDG